MLSQMLAISASAHQNQYDKAGKPYFLHCLAVMQLLNTDDEELQCIALGHDLFEDTTWTIAMLREEGFNERVIAGITAMIKQRGQSYDEYKTQVKSNCDAVLVKMADLTHNSDIRRMKEVSQKDFDRTIRYRQFYNELKSVLEAV
jgi:(p)ppGpp synthase/HD superfamily hydrolase